MEQTGPLALVNFRLDPGTIALARRFAEAQGMSLSALIRRGLRREIGMPESFLSLDVENGGGCRIPHESLHSPADDAAAEGGA